MKPKGSQTVQSNSFSLSEEKAESRSSSRTRSLSRKKNKEKKSNQVEQREKVQTMSKKLSDVRPNKCKGLQLKINLAAQKAPKERFQSFIEISVKILTAIQLLEYNGPHAKLCQSFKTIVKDYVTFNGVFPKALNRIGKELLKDGIFHEMWGKICKKDNKSSQLTHYYQYYYAQLESNHANFEAAFNQQSISIDYIPISTPQHDPEEDSNTRLTRQARNKSSRQPSSFLRLPEMRTQNEDSIMLQQSRLLSGRLKLIDQIQSNERRINAEIVCYFLGITQFYSLIDLQINKIVEFYHSNGKELLILQAHLPVYKEELRKTVIDFRPRILVAMYGYVSLAQLLRVKMQYDSIEGFVLYDELLNLELWLRANDYLLPK